MNKTMIPGQALGGAVAVMLLCLGLASCGIMAPIANRVPSDEEGEKRVSELVGRFEQACLGRDLTSDPYPRAGQRISDKVGFNYEVQPGSCVMWDTAESNWGEYDKTFVTFDRGRVVREFKRRFGVIYHQSAPASHSCASGDSHLMLLRDSTTVVELKFMAMDHSSRICKGDYWLAFGFELTPGRHMDRDPDEPYIVDRLDVINLERLNEDERQKVADQWGRMSAAAKNKHTKRIAGAIKSIDMSQKVSAKRFHESRAISREFNQRRQREEERSAAALNEILMGAMTELNKESAEMNTRNADRTQQRAVTSQINAAFGDIKGFDASQLPGSIQLQGTSSKSAAVVSGQGDGNVSLTYYQRQQEIENRRRDMARQQQEQQRELENRQEAQRQMIARQQEERRQARERRQQELREQQRRAREQKQREDQRRAEEQMQKQQRENERRMKQLAQASKNVAPPNCQSYAETIPQMDKICFKESKRQYRCTQRNGEPFLSYIQTLIFDSSVEEGSHCDVVDRTNTHPNGSPYGTPFDK